MSAFDSLEKQYAERACREVEELAQGVGKENSAIEEAQKERRNRATGRYAQEYENKFYKYMIRLVSEDRDAIISTNPTRLDGTPRQPPFPEPSKDNLFSILKDNYNPIPDFPIPSYAFTNEEGERRQYIDPEIIQTILIPTKEKLLSESKLWAATKYNNLENEGFNLLNTGGIQNSPHYDEMNDAIREVYENEMTMTKALIDTMKGKNQYSLSEMIPLIGLCGISKVGKKALDCLANGISFDQFLDILISKFFEYIQINYLNLLFEDLPADVQNELNAAIAKEFGPNVKLADIFGVNTASGGTMKAKDIITMGNHTKRIIDLFKRHKDPFATGTDDEKEYLVQQLGKDLEGYVDIQAAFLSYYDYKNKIYLDILPISLSYKKLGEDDPKDLPLPVEKWVLKRVKYILRGNKTRSESFKAASDRFFSAVGTGIASPFVGTYNALAEGVDQIQARSEKKKTLEAIEESDNRISQIPAEIEALQQEQAKVSAQIDNIRINEYQVPPPPGDAFDANNPGPGLSLEQLQNEQQGLDTQLDDLWDKFYEIQEQISAKQKEAQTANDESTRLEDINEDLDDEIVTFREATQAIGEQYDEYKAESLNKYEQAEKNFQETALGVKVDIVFDIIFDYMIDWIMESLSIDTLFAYIKQYPAAEFAVDALGDFLFPSCPTAPVVYPPPNNFMKSLKVDVCDPQMGLVLPEMRIPSIDWKFHVQKQFGELFREAIIRVVTKVITKLVIKFMKAIESALCNLAEAAGKLAADALKGDFSGGLEGFSDALYDALNEAFCNDGDDPATARSKAEALADELFNLNDLDPSANYEDAGKKVAALIGSVASAEDILGAIVAREGEESDRFNNNVSNIVDVLAPEMRVLLGSPDQVAYFFKNLGSFLSPEDRDRIRNLLDAGIPNMPISEAICLTDEELDNWNDLRNNLLQGQGLTPEQASQRVSDLNRRAREAVEEMVDDIYALDSGDLLGDELLNELSKDVCNAENILNLTSASSVAKIEQNQTTQAFYKNLEDSIQRGFTGKNGILGEAMRDFENNTEFINTFYNFFNKNYQRTQIERTNYRTNTNFINGVIMDILAPDGQAAGVYPNTVGITQREKILADDGKIYTLTSDASDITYRFHDVFKVGFYEYSFIQKVMVENRKSFNYKLFLKEKVDDEQQYTEMKTIVPVSISADKQQYMEELGFQYGSDEYDNVRESLFNTFVNTSIPLVSKDYSQLYRDAFEEFNKSVVEMLLTDPNQIDDIPVGYQFGYIPDDITSADDLVYYNPDTTTPYNLEESEKKLGDFAHPRVIALDPGLYGGRYSNPPYYIEPRAFSGWVELATKAFVSPSGCNPKIPSLLNFDDIKQRTEMLQSSLREDSRLAEDPECAADKPFHALMDKNTKSYIDGVVRSTLRTYLAEYFFKGYGLFSGLELRAENYDQAMFEYIAKKMKKEMYELGTTFASNFKTIVREKYWYTFLEQCVEAYQRMVEVDGITPPENVQDALNYIQKGLDQYVSCSKATKNGMSARMKANNNVIRIPSKNYDPLTEASRGAVTMTLQAVAFRLTVDEEDKINFFNGGEFTDFNRTDLFFSSVKKLKFFQKIYFIALFEKQATIIMSELIRQEFNRLSENIVDGLYDRPRHQDLMKSIFSAMPGSSSRIGLGEYYANKNTEANVDTGKIPEVKGNNETSPVPLTDKPQFIVESYGRLVDREDPDLPPQIRNRPQKYVGAIPLSDMSEFFSQSSNLFGDNYLSDFFGNLTFVYKGSIKQLFDKGFTDDFWINRLLVLNKGEIPGIVIKNARNNYLASRDDDFVVTYDQAFVLPEEEVEPSGTYGTTGVRYGIRLSLVFPEGFLDDADIATLKSNPNFAALSRNEKSYLFEDGSFVLPLVSEEIDLVDETFRNTNPISGEERYDLECLINKISARTDYQLFMENIFNLKQISSMLSIYCMETMMPSIGKKVAPPEGGTIEEGYERAMGYPDPDNEWDGTINERGKNSLRKQFKALYLARTPDGLNTANDDGFSLSFSGLFAFGNPFDFAFQLPKISIPWWRRRRVRTRIYDANGNECADPKKDLQ